MLLHLPGRTERLSGALLLMLLGVLLAAVSASVPVKHCPNRIDCARAGRQFCKPGSSQCGPCLSLQEDEEGHCLPPISRHSNHSKAAALPDLDEQIDYLSSVIAKDEASAVRQPDSSKPKNLSTLKKAHSNLNTLKPVTYSPFASTPQTLKPPVEQTKVPGHGKHIGATFPEDSLIIIMMSAFIILGCAALLMAAVCWFRIQKENHFTQKVDYPAFYSGGSNSSSCNSLGDKKLARSAQMYHYQHQKQQMLSMEKHKVEPKVSEPGAVSEEETEEGDFTVYECPGLAPTGEMEVKNPLFDDSTLQNGRNHK